MSSYRERRRYRIGSTSLLPRTQSGSYFSYAFRNRIDQLTVLAESSYFSCPKLIIRYL